MTKWITGLVACFVTACVFFTMGTHVGYRSGFYNGEDRGKTEVRLTLVKNRLEQAEETARKHGVNVPDGWFNTRADFSGSGRQKLTKAGEALVERIYKYRRQQSALLTRSLDLLKTAPGLYKGLYTPEVYQWRSKDAK